MAASQKVGGISSKSWENRETSEEDDGRDTVTLLDVFTGTLREKIVLQQLIVIARLPRHLHDRTEVGAHYERLNFQISKHYIWDHMTGLLLIYPNYLLHIIESSRDVLFSVLKDLKDIQQQTQCLLEAPKVVFMTHGAQSRLFQQWSYKVLDEENPAAKGLEEEDESTETLVCSVLAALQNLSKHLELSKMALPGLLLDKNPELIVPQNVLEKLQARGELLSPQLYLQMYDSPVNIRMTFGQGIQGSCLSTI
ncbi:testis-expressed protein 47 isoform X1 [Solea solea]|uniref:testis-expressed protein 47 isoform X1 n=1 Tax=Solea solea TaxID=90069 RepID=UPI00272990C1|nr:testis-expressed protein 47 isoform X1 [Solea solea]